MDEQVQYQAQYLEVHSQTHIKSSLPYDFPLGFYREGTILPVFVGRRFTASQVGLLRVQIYWPWALPCNFRAPPCKRRHCPWPGFTGAAGVFTGSSPAYSQSTPTVYSPRSSPAHSQGVTCAFTGHVACAATPGRPRAPQLPRAQAPGSRPCAAAARRPWVPGYRQVPVRLACPVVRVP